MDERLRKLKELINEYVNIYSDLCYKFFLKDGGIEDNLTKDKFEWNLKGDFIEFMLYLTASDGEIKWEETQLISNIFDINISPAKAREFMESQNVYSKEFESKVPNILGLMVAFDNMIYKENNHILPPDGKWNSEKLLNIYAEIAKTIIRVDGDVDKQELIDAEIYLKMMENYINENLESRKQSVSVIRKEEGLQKNMPKNGVPAPKKR